MRGYTSKFFIVRKWHRGRIIGFYQRFRSKCKKCRSLDDIWLLSFAARRRLWKYESTSVRSNNSYPSFLLLPPPPSPPSPVLFLLLLRNITLLLAAKIFYSTCSSIIVHATRLSRYTASVVVATQQSYPHEMFEIISRLYNGSVYK